MRVLASVLFLALLCGASPALADKEKAREHYKKGMAQFVLDHHDDAIREFEQGFAEEPDPAFLYNIGQAYRLSARPEKALTYYRKYLEMAPKAKNRAEVEGFMGGLEQEIQKKGTKEVKEVKPEPRPEPKPEPEPEPAPTMTTPLPAAATATTTATATSQKPARRTWPIWVGVAAGVVVVAGVVVAAVLATRPSEPVLPLENAR